MKKKRLGEGLRERGHVTVEDLNKALQDQRGKLVRLGELLLQRGKVSKKDLVAALDEVTQVPYIDCTTVEVPEQILKLIPAAMARRHKVLPIKLEGNKLAVAMAEPQNLQIMDQLRFKTAKEIVPRLGLHGELRCAIAKHYGWDETPLRAGFQRPPLSKPRTCSSFPRASNNGISRR
jgi:Type II secretion system (T2SS), protein E, N-terminal domain